ncbi:hypothetical protein PtB15_1B390 [Puccinia triticina]|nr:hypothetical protein PtB15_1B390 [Puccinia triticina]
MALFTPIPGQPVLPHEPPHIANPPTFVDVAVSSDRFIKTTEIYCKSMVPVDSTPLAKATNSMVKTSLLSITQTALLVCMSILEPLAAILIPEIRDLIEATRAQTQVTLALQDECRVSNRAVVALQAECCATNQAVVALQEESRATNQAVVALREESRASNRGIMTQLVTIDTRLGNIENRLTRIEEITNTQLNLGQEMADHFGIPAPQVPAGRAPGRPGLQDRI